MRITQALLLAAQLILAAQPLTVHAQPAGSVQEALLSAKPAVAVVVTEVSADVRVTCAPGKSDVVRPAGYRESGSGWFVNAAGWMVTTAHVVSVAHQPPAWLERQQVEQAVRKACLPDLLRERGLAPGARPDIEDDLVRSLLATASPRAQVTFSPTLSVILSNGARLPARVVKYSPPLAGEAMSGRDLALVRVAAADVSSLPLADSGRANIGDALHLIGFPNAVTTHELLSSSAKVEASVTSGAISGFKQDLNGRPVIQTDAAAAPGANGGPAVDSTGAVLGMLAFVMSDEGTVVVQGFNYVIPSAAIREFLADTDVAIGEPGRFDVAWRAGLATYFGGDYAAAARRLREADRLLPNLPDVRRVMADNAARARRAPLLPWRLVGAAMLGVAVVGWSTVWIQRRRRNEFRIAPSEVARLIQASQAPVILDVRDDAAYAKSPVRIPQSVHVTLDGLASSGGLEVDRSRTVVAYCT